MNQRHSIAGSRRVGTAHRRTGTGGQCPPYNVLLVLIVALTGRAFADDAPDTSAEPKTPNRSFAHFGVSFRPPVGWREQMRDSYSVIGWWVSPPDGDAKSDTPRPEIRVEGNRSPETSLAQAAKALSQQWDGKLAGETTLGGEPAMRVVTTPPEKGEGKRPVEGIVCKHDKFLYLVMGGITPGGQVHDVLEAVRESWKWVAIESPSKQLGFARQPYRIFGRVLIDLPALMSLEAVDDASRQAHFAMPSPQRADPEWLCLAQLAPRDPDQTFEALSEAFLKKAEGKTKPNPEPAWEPIKGGTAKRLITNRYEAELTGKTGEKPQRLTVQWGLVELDPKTVVLINFTYGSTDAADQARYEVAARKVVASIRIAPPSKKPAAAPDPKPPLKKQ